MLAAPRPTLRAAAPVALLALAAASILACSTPPLLLPPPFGPDQSKPQPTRLFFPTGLAVQPTSGHLLVVNGNFNHEFDSGSLVAIDPNYLKAAFAGPPADPGDPLQPLPVALPSIDGRRRTTIATGWI